MTVEKIINDALNSGVFLYLENEQLKYKSRKGGFPEALKTDIKKYKDEVIAYLKSIENQTSKPKQQLPSLDKVDRNLALPLSFAQQRLWLLDKIEDGSAHYNIPSSLKLTGKLDIQALNQAFTTILERHESLRTCFKVDAKGEPVQVIREAAPFVASMTDLSGLEEGERRLQLMEKIAREADGVFDLGEDLMLRAQLINVAEDEHILLVTMHHIASDGWSMSILINEFSALYDAYTRGRENPLTPLPIQYADYAYWQRNWLRGEVLDQQFDYWNKQLDGLPIVHGLPLDRARPAMQSFVGDTYASQIDVATSQILKQLCQSQGASLFMGLHAAFSVLLSRYSNETDIVIGSPVANRGQTEIAGLIGFFVNTLVLRSDLSECPGFTALLNQSKEMLLDAYAHQQVPFERIVERMQPDRSLSYSPLFQVLLILHNNAKGSLELPGLRLNPIEKSGPGVAKYDLTLEVTESGHGLWLHWEYNTDLFEDRTIARMAEHFGLLLKALVRNPDENVFKADMLKAQERHQLLVKWNNTGADYPKDKCIQELFETQVENNPDAVAVIFEDRQLTYGELNQKANQLAHYLTNERQVKPDTLVGISIDRSLDMLVGILAILKAGGAYVPLDPQYPQARLAYMLEDAKLTTVLTQNHLCATVPVSNAQVVCLDDETLQQQLLQQSTQNPDGSHLGLTSSHLAYVIYTSGSTGNPKGVMVEHSNVVNFLTAMRHQPGISAQDCLLAVTSTSFDIHGLELFLPLVVGASLVVANNDATASPDALNALLKQHRVSIMQATPATWKMLLEANWQMDLALRERPLKVLCGGEALSLHLATALLEQPKLELWNMYGPTETTIWSTTQRILPRPEKVLMGRPIANTQVYITSTEKEPVPVGVAGELLIGGVGVTRGYLNRPDLTEEKFIPNPFHDKNNPSSSKRLYRTGDLVRWLSDGNLEFLGRIDHQVKIRGFRIELGEIENTLNTHADVKDAVVLAKEPVGNEMVGSGDKRLVAYVVSSAVDLQDQSELSVTAQHELIANLRHYLSQTLPDYMLPSVFVFLTELPLTPNGKVDRKVLPEPDVSAQRAVYIAPRTETEKLLCDMWQEILGVDRVSVTDNFFQLGGHSLLATRLVARIKQTLNVTLPLKTLFSSQTLEGLGQAVLQLDPDYSRPPLVKVSREQDLPASYAQQRLWLLDKIDGGSAHYNIPGALKLTGTLNIQALNQAFTSLVERHESLRTCFAAGEDGQPIQVIQAAAPVVVPMTDLSALKENEGQRQLAEFVTEESSRVFDLSRELMLRAQLIKLAEEEYILLVTMHHIASDGWSMSILINEFSALYSAHVQGRENPLRPLSIQYADYAHWQRNWLQGDVLDQQLNYWTTQLADLPVLHSLPLDHPRPSIQTFVGKTHLSQIDSATSKALSDLCRLQGATLFMGLQAAFSVLLSRYSNATDIVIGSPIANREQEEVAGLIGFFANTLVLRSDLSTSPSFIDLLQQSKNMLLEAYAHQQVPFEQIVERLQPQRSQSHSPLFQVMLVLQNNEAGSLELPGLTLGPVEQDGVGVAKYDLTLNVFESGQGLSLGWEYNTDLFEQQTISNMAMRLDLLLKGLLAKPEQSVFKAEMLNVPERHQLLVEWNDTATDYAKDECIHELFEAQVENNPNAIAVTFEDQQLTYAELNQKTNQLAHYLINEKQVKPDTLVGICVERSLDMVVGILAILKAGGAYVPLDPQYPEARLAYMLGDAKLTTVLTQSHLREVIPVVDEQAVYLDNKLFEEHLKIYPQINPGTKEQGLTSRHLAYVIYTSGSTGNPKGVMQSHQTITNLVQGLAIADGIEKPLKTLQFASINFDVSLQELATAWHTGSNLLLIRNEVKLNLTELPKVLQQEVIERLFLPPAVLYWLAESLNEVGVLPHLKELFVAGEALMITDAVRTFLDSHGSCRLWNHYGPTETHVVTRYCANTANGMVPIGAPVPNTQSFVFNEQKKLVPVGVAGELHVGGACLARSYLNQPDLTAEKFIANPFHDKSDPSSCERLYKTGDLVRWLPDGNLEFLGRIDHQVKIRGFRIELHEIEHILNSHTDVRDSVVLAKTSASSEDKHLVAYVVTDAVASDCEGDDEANITVRRGFIEILRHHLSESLPDYMLPSSFVLLESLPLTPNGKVNRQALPEPDLSMQQSAFVAPRTEVEKALCEIWQDVLGVERVGITDNFFQLGGHSLLVMKLIRVLESRLEVVGLEASVVFHAPVLKALATYLTVLSPRFSLEAQNVDEQETEVFEL